MISSRRRWLCAALGGLALGGCAGEGADLGPADAYLLLGPVTPTRQSEPAGLPVVHRLKPDDGPPLALARLLADGFGAEIVRTVYLAKQLVRRGSFEGRRFPEAARAAADHPLCLVVGLEGGRPVAHGLAFERLLRKPLEVPDLTWLGFPGDLDLDKALVQSLSGRLAAHAAHWVASGGTLAPLAPPSARLVDAYRMAMEVIAREWRLGTGPAGVLPSTAGSGAQRELFAGIRENRLVLTANGGELRPPQELLDDAGVAATVLYRMAQTRGIAHRHGPAELYAPFVPSPLPEGVAPAQILGAFRNFQAKLLSSWARVVLADRPPRDVVDLVEAYVALFPAERAEVLRIFLVTTFGGTAKAGGVSRRPEDAKAALAELAALGEEIAAGKRTLRAAVAPSH